MRFRTPGTFLKQKFSRETPPPQKKNFFFGVLRPQEHFLAKKKFQLNIFRLNPALTVKVFFSLDYTSLGCLERISSGYQEDILEQFEKSKMAAKMAAIAKKKLNHLILLIKSRVISLFPLNVIRGIHFWGYFCNLRSITRSNIILKVIYSTIRQY